MKKDIKVSTDQNTVLVDGVAYGAKINKARYTVDCQLCSFERTYMCDRIPCSSIKRNDRTGVYFTLKEETHELSANHYIADAYLRGVQNLWGRYNTTPLFQE